ncbi:MAG: cytochrome b N-terminal domain-containing protein [Thermodesulfobacteriota bacterium]
MAQEKMWQRFCAVPWGEVCLVSLYLSVLSGIVVALQYDFGTPFYSSSSMDLLLPFGSFWRSLHFYTSQFFFITLLVHFAAILADGRVARLALGKWLLLVGSLPVALLLLFTGYVLRGDATGHSAGLIAENILLAIPGLGEALNRLLFSIADDGLKRVYANHLVGLGILWGGLSWDHVRKYRAHVSRHGLLIVASLLMAFIFFAPLEPEQLGVFHTPGPWFFLGLQEILRYIQPFWAGVVFPLLFIFALAGLHPVMSPRSRRFCQAAASLWLLLYLILTLLALARS